MATVGSYPGNRGSQSTNVLMLYSSLASIIIKRTQLESLEKYAGTLLHEVVHVVSGAKDVTRDFEDELTKLLGIIVSKALRK